MIIPFYKLAYSFLLRSGEGGFNKDLWTSIAEKGLLTPLTAMPFCTVDGRDRYMVLDGQARMRAMAVLVKQEKITPKYSVPCEVVKLTRAGFEEYQTNRGVAASKLETFFQTTTGRGLLRAWQPVLGSGRPDAITPDYSAVEFKVGKAIHEGKFGIPYNVQPTFVQPPQFSGSPNRLGLKSENHAWFSADINSVETHLPTDSFRFDVVSNHSPQYQLPEWLKDYCMPTATNILVRVRCGPYEFNLKLNGERPVRHAEGWSIQLRKPITPEQVRAAVNFPQPVTVRHGQTVAIDWENQAFGRRSPENLLAVVEERTDATGQMLARKYGQILQHTPISKSFDLGDKW